jgi:CubicO group peptidase (beta-lactamase class C family)
MSLRHVATLALAVIAVAGPAHAAGSLNETLRPYLRRYGLPALAAATVERGRVLAAGAVGTRRAGAAIPVGVGDRFHIGSDTKAMTALVAAMLVEEGKLRWASTVGEVFPELAATMDAGLRGVTLEQLLSHTSGLPADDVVFEDLLAKSMTQEGNLDELRYWLLQRWSARPLAAAGCPRE